MPLPLVQDWLPFLTARLYSRFCLSAHVSLHGFNVPDTLFEAVFHCHLRENTTWKTKSPNCAFQERKKLQLVTHGSVRMKVQRDMQCHDGLMATSMWVVVKGTLLKGCKDFSMTSSRQSHGRTGTWLALTQSH